MIEYIWSTLLGFNLTTYLLIFTCIFVAFTYFSKDESVQGRLPPHIPSTLPYLGNAISFGKSPIEFLLAAYKQYGPVFSFTMMGHTFTYLIGSDSAELFFNSRNENLNAEEVYGKLVTPVFGKGVAYDVPNDIFMEQKKVFKTGLNIARFRQHVPMIVEETANYFKSWGDRGAKDLFEALSELIILTASRCLHGKEIRKVLSPKIAQLYTDLDGGFTPAAWLLPAWLPLPSFRRRDEAHRKIKEIFYKAIAERRENGPEDDMLQTIIDSRYKSGRAMTDDEVAGMLIGLLMAGQHTSSTTSAWMGFFLAKHQDVQEACYEEQVRSCHGDLSAPLDFDMLRECPLLERCVKETLRLRPPIMTMMRMCKTPQKVKGYTIPPGHQICVSPTTNHRLPDTWENFDQWDPDRFLGDSAVTSSEKFSYVPFGAGRHRCIGESFAYVQIKTIWAVLLRKYRFTLNGGHFPEVNFRTMIHTPVDPVVCYEPRVQAK